MNSALGRARTRSALVSLTLPRFAARESGRPFVVALEGPNGVGKTTLAHALSRTLGVPRCLGTDEGWFSDSFKVRMIRDAAWYASALFFLSGCFEQMRVLRTFSHPLVVMDRSMWSTLAVQAAQDTGRLATLIAMLRPLAREIQVPDLTLVLEASFTTSRSRIARKTGNARALDELTATAAFHAREHRFYRWLGRQIPAVSFLDVDRATPAQAAAGAVALIRSKHPC